MTVSKFWDGVEDFYASEAAYLILGIEPAKKDGEISSSYHRLVREMHKSYLDTCAHVRYCLERDLHPDYISEFKWRYVEDGELISLPCVAMNDLLGQVEEVVRYSEYLQCRNFVLDWLDGAIESFETQRFPRWALGEWVSFQRISSEYEFDAAQTLTPEQRRERVRLVLADCGGNKTEAGRRLGISRQRVDQLLEGKTAARSNPLHPPPQDPFGRTGRAVED